MSDWARVARERFKWLERVAELRGVSVGMGPYEESTERIGEGDHKVIQIDMGADTAK